MSDLEILKILIEELEMQNMNLRPTKSYGAGHPWVEKQTPKQVLGTSMYPDEDESEKPKQPQKVQVSKVFKQRT